MTRGLGARGVARVLLLCCACACADSGRREAAASTQAEPEGAPKVAKVAAKVADAAAEPAAAQAAVPQLFGAPLDPGTPELSLAQLLAAPAEHAGKTVRTRGTIARVCQRMGCWMELHAEDAPSAVRIPMADHAYFLPQTVVGRAAEIQGKVQVAALSEGHKRHLQSEGARATDGELSIAATGVHVR